jgi:hypothetical protein
VHQAGLCIVLEAIRKLNAPASYRFANGQILIGAARLAFIMGDQPAHDKHMERNPNHAGCVCALAISWTALIKRFLHLTGGRADCHCFTQLMSVWMTWKGAVWQEASHWDVGAKVRHSFHAQQPV